MHAVLKVVAATECRSFYEQFKVLRKQTHAAIWRYIAVHTLQKNGDVIGKFCVKYCSLALLILAAEDLNAFFPIIIHRAGKKYVRNEHRQDANRH